MALGQVQHEESVTSRTRILGRKRVLMSNNLDSSELSSPLSGPLRRKRGTRSHMENTSRLELLPQDVLVRILCKVNRSDLKQLLLVSKFVHRATSIAKEVHFAFSTPSSKPVFGRGRESGEIDFEASEEALNAPKQQRVARSRIDGKTLSSVAVALFTSPEEQWPKNVLAEEL